MKRNKRFVAITGGIGSGKSTVAKIIAEMGYPVFSADTVARGIYSDSEVYKKVAEYFPDCLSDTGVDRKKLAAAVFSDSAKLQLLDRRRPLCPRRGRLCGGAAPVRVRRRQRF